MDYNRLLFGFEGRINRARYVLSSLMILCGMIFSLLLLAVICISHGISTGPLSINLVGISASIDYTLDNASAAPFPRVALLVLSLGFGWRYLAASVRRLHDRNKSGWWIVAYLVVPGLHGQFGAWLGDSWPAVLLDYATSFACFWGLVEMYCLKGTPGPNRFGSDPLEPADSRIQEAQRWEQHAALEFPVAGAGPWPAPHVKRGA